MPNDAELKEILVRMLNQQIETTDKLAKLVEETKKEIPDTVAEVFNETASTTEKTVRCPAVNGKRLPWKWVHIENLGDTNLVKIGINGDSDVGITINAGASKTIDYKDLVVKYIKYETATDETSIQIIGLRPEYKGPR